MLENELVAYKKEQRTNFWKKVGFGLTGLTLILSTSIAGCAYVLDRTTAKFDEQERTDKAIIERVHEQETKTATTDMILKQVLDMQQQGREDIREIKEAQHRIELSIAKERRERTP
jgi:hypothetical protein